MELGHLLFTIFSAFFGLAVGSFLNVCIYRIPKGTFFTEKHSYCPKCGQPLNGTTWCRFSAGFFLAESAGVVRKNLRKVPDCGVAQRRIVDVVGIFYRA